VSLQPAPAQTIIGFGASGAWWPDDVVGFSPANRALVARLLFDRSAGLGLSIYRYNIGGGGVGVHAAAAPPTSRTSTGSRRGQACRDPE
jgi:O-glycosyl hydrolase